MLVLLQFKHQLTRDSILPAFYAVTGSDTVSQFARHGKVTAWKTWKQNNQFRLISISLQKKHSAALRSSSEKYMNRNHKY